MTAAVAGVARLLRDEAGIVLSAAQETSLRAALARAAPGLDPDGFLRAARDPARGGELLSRLIDEVTVQETMFARDRRQLDDVGWRELHRQALAAGTGTIRVWSAGCAAGEEPYTLALLAAEAFTPDPPPVDVLGTDISRAALSAAAAGRYRARAMRGLGDLTRLRFFSRQPDGTYVIAGPVRALVRFRRHNLARDPFPPPGEAPFHLVVCRNVLIYFPPALAARVIGRFGQCLQPGGRLLLGAADALHRTGAAEPPAPVPARPPAARPVTGRPGRPQPSGARGERLAAAFAAADEGDHRRAAGLAGALLRDDPLDADAHFIQGLVALETGDPAQAVAALRRALYADGTFALAAFTLGRAYDALGDGAAACRSYRQTLALLDPGDERHEVLLQQVDIGDIAAACRARLGG